MCSMGRREPLNELVRRVTALLGGRFAKLVGTIGQIIVTAPTSATSAVREGASASIKFRARQFRIWRDITPAETYFFSSFHPFP